MIFIFSCFLLYSLFVHPLFAQLFHQQFFPFQESALFLHFPFFAFWLLLAAAGISGFFLFLLLAVFLYFPEFLVTALFLYLFFALLQLHPFLRFFLFQKLSFLLAQSLLKEFLLVLLGRFQEAPQILPRLYPMLLSLS